VISMVVKILLNFNEEIYFSYFICVIRFVPHLRCSLFPVSVWRPIFFLARGYDRTPSRARSGVSLCASDFLLFFAIPFGSICARCLPARVLFPDRCSPEELVRLSESIFCSCLFASACNLQHRFSHQVSASIFFWNRPPHRFVATAGLCPVLTSLIFCSFFCVIRKFIRSL
jgi:hypothetical protein